MRGRMIHRHRYWHGQSRQAYGANALPSRTVDCAEHHLTSDNRRSGAACRRSPGSLIMTQNGVFWRSTWACLQSLVAG